MKSAGKARSNGLYRHIRTSKEIIRNLLNDSVNSWNRRGKSSFYMERLLRASELERCSCEKEISMLSVQEIMKNI